MTTSMLLTPTSPHFFKPLLPGFKTHLLIPETFYFKYLEGKEEGNTAILKSNASEINWKITVDGKKLTHGWEKFAVAHNLKVGDILVFKHEGNLTFHVTPLGPSCCEILYSHNGQNQMGMLHENSEMKNKTGDHEYIKEQENVESLSLLDDCSYVVPVTVTNLSYDRLYLPMKFSRSIANEGLQKICLMNKHGERWTLGLRKNKSKGQFSIGGGWRSFCEASGQKAGCSFSFKPARHGTNLVLLMNETLKGQGV